HLPRLHACVAIAEIDVTAANRLHLGPEQRHAGLERLEDVVVVKRLAVFRVAFLGLFALRPHLDSKLYQLCTTLSVRNWTSRAASRTASIRLEGSAIPRPAMSKAVPWSTEVRMIGRPSVTLTARPKATS